MVSLEKDELRALLSAAKAKRERDWLMILVAFWHGLRASEVVGLTPDNVRDGFLTIQRLKESLKTTHALVADPDPLFSEKEALIDYASKLLPNQRIFKISRSQFFRLVQSYAKAAGIPAHKRHPHVLKHTIAMQTIRTAGVENVRQYLGHKSGGSTLEYLKVTDEEAATAVQGSMKSHRID